MTWLWTLLLLLNTIGRIQASTCGPDNWGPWSVWSACSVSCGGGSRTRTRTCTTQPCTGAATQTGYCNYDECPPTVCPDDAVPPDAAWKLGTVDISTPNSVLMVGTVDTTGHKLGLCWSFTDLSPSESVSIISPPCNRLRAGTVNGRTPTGQYLGPACTYEVKEDEETNISVSNAGGTCDISQYATASDCPTSGIVEVTFFSQKKDVGVLLNVEPPGDEVSILVGLLGNSNTLIAARMARYNGTMRALPGTPWKAVLYNDNNMRVLINGQCSYTTTDMPKQTVFVGPVCGGWGDWGPWEECNRISDFVWRQRRRRPCDSPRPINDGKCEGNQYQYRRCVCEAPIIPSMATTGELQPGYNWGDRVAVCCQDGYMSERTGRRSFIVACNYYNRWLGFENCIRPVYPVPVFSDGMITAGAMGSYSQGDEVTVVCNEGFVNEFCERTFTSTLMGNTWVPSTCVPKVCKALPYTPNAILDVTDGMTFRPGDTVGLTCKSGYTLSSATVQIMCNDDCTWTPNPSDVMCRGHSCETPDLVGNNIGAFMRTTSSVNRAVITCMARHTMQGQRSYTSVCQPNGTWSNLRPCQSSDGGVGIGLELDGPSIGLIAMLCVVGVGAAVTACAFIGRSFFRAPSFASRIPLLRGSVLQRPRLPRLPQRRLLRLPYRRPVPVPVPVPVPQPVQVPVPVPQPVAVHVPLVQAPRLLAISNTHAAPDNILQTYANLQHEQITVSNI